MVSLYLFIAFICSIYWNTSKIGGKYVFFDLCDLEHRRVKSRNCIKLNDDTQNIFNLSICLDQQSFFFYVGSAKSLEHTECINKVHVKMIRFGYNIWND